MTLIIEELRKAIDIIQSTINHVSYHKLNWIDSILTRDVELILSAATLHLQAMEKEVVNEDELLPCPFCHETDCDLSGLKRHLSDGECEVFNKTQVVPFHTCSGTTPKEK